MNCVYGPVASWRLGKSLGIDVLCSSEKICSFDCTYCQLEKTKELTNSRREFVNTEILVEQVKKALKKTDPDVLTFSGTGEPTLATNIKKIHNSLKNITNKPFAIITNSTLFYDKSVRSDLLNLDIIIVKLDASNHSLFEEINHPTNKITFNQTLEGIKKMKEEFKGKFALQIMFIEKNKIYADNIAKITREINPDEVQINTPLRPCNEKPLSIKELDEIEEKFKGLNTISVYHSDKPTTNPLDKIEIFKRRRMDV